MSSQTRNASSKVVPIEHRIHVGDTCALKSDPKRVGVVGRTFYDVDTHLPDPRQRLHSLERNPAISSHDYTSFVNTGIPPRGTVVLTWLDRSGLAKDTDITLTPESELRVIDRELLTGDVVKLSPRDSMCGVVIAEHMQVDLLPPRRWPQASSSTTNPPQPLPDDLIKGVSANDIRLPIDFAVGQLVLYNNWVGRIMDYFETVKVRLSNGSVVQLEDPTELEGVGAEVDAGPDVGHYIITKKSNLRRGQWIYGAYQPNVAPVGYVAELQPQEIEVEWLCQKYAMSELDPISGVPPPSFIDISSISPDSIKVYERFTAPNREQSEPLPLGARSLDIGIGDKVRFRNLYDADNKYEQKLCYIPRTDTLGFDTNVYTVASTYTKVLVQWQDLTTNHYKSTDLTPALDMDIGEDVFPGELVITKKVDRSSDTATLKPERVGIVQSLDSRNRIAKVRWFDGSVTFAGDDSTLMLPGSYTGSLGLPAEETSLYDIWPGLPRKVGDIVALQPATVDAVDPRLPHLVELYAALYATAETFDWVGEVVELSVEGYLTVRLGASANPRDIRVPWECTLLIEAAAYDMEGSDASYGSASSDNEHMDIDGSFDGVWVDENDDPVETSGQDADWMTSDESDNQGTADIAMPNAPDRGEQHPRESSPSCLFSYDGMSKPEADTPHALPSLEPFMILDGRPSEHHFATRAGGELDGQRLRRILKEHKILRSSVPAGIYVRTWESSLDLMRVLILGPLGTPYEYAPFMIDLYLDPSFPTRPPQTFFHSWTDSTGPVNPNLYEDGKICLSLLGTWPGDNPGDTWSPKSTILQILVSIVGLVLVREPYYNEAGFEVRAGAAETLVPSAQYSERTYLRSRMFILRALASNIEGFNDTIKDLYRSSPAPSGPMLLIRAIWTSIKLVRRSHVEIDEDLDDSRSEAGLKRITAGAVVPLRRSIEAMIDHVSDGQSELKRMLVEPVFVASGGPDGIFDKLGREDKAERGGAVE